MYLWRGNRIPVSGSSARTSVVTRNENRGRRERAGLQGDIRGCYRRRLNIESRNGASADLHRELPNADARGWVGVAVDRGRLVVGMRRWHDAAARRRHDSHQPREPAHKQSPVLIAVGIPGLPPARVIIF